MLTKTYSFASKIADLIEKEKSFEKIMITFIRSRDGKNNTIVFIRADSNNNGGITK